MSKSITKLNRKRGTLFVPQEMQTSERLSTKKELAEKERHPTCPFVPVKMRKNIHNQSINLKPTPICFNNNVMLSPIYDPKARLPYLDQVFAKFGCMGEGSFGKVYRVRSREDKKLYAIKRLKANISFKDRYAEVKNNEIIGFSPYCVQFFMAWDENRETFLLLEYCDMSLADYSKLNNDVPKDLLCNVLYDMSQALRFLHKRNLLHLDVKPGNIMMKKGFYKLGDFGLLVDLQMKSHACKSTLSDGDSKYLAIEVLDGVYTGACDIFGLGLTLLELATDIELPDHGPLWHQLRHDILPSGLFKRVSLSFKAIIQRMITSEYKRRPSAEKILSYSSMKDIGKRDSKKARTDFAVPFVSTDDKYDVLPLSPISFNNNDNTTTPPCSLRPSYDDDYSSFYSSENNEENSITFSGRRSLFSRFNQNSLFSNNGFSPCENGVLASSLNDSGMEVENESSDFSLMQGDNLLASNDFLITSTPVLRTRQNRRIPKAKLTFD